MSTEDYGKMWLDFSHDTKQNLKLVGDSLADTLNVLTSKLQLHVVEIIGKPSIPSKPFQGVDTTLNMSSPFYRDGRDRSLPAAPQPAVSPPLPPARGGVGGVAALSRPRAARLPDLSLSESFERALSPDRKHLRRPAPLPNTGA